MTKYSFHLVNSGALCDPVHKLRFRLNQDFWVSPKETSHTHQILFLLSLSCGSFWWTLSIFALLSRGIKKVNSLTLSAHYNWTTLIPAYSCHRWATFPLLVASLWLFVARKSVEGVKVSISDGIQRGSLKSEFGRDLIHTLHCTEEEAGAERWPPPVIQAGSGGAGTHPGVLSPCSVLFAGIRRHHALLQVPLCAHRDRVPQLADLEWLFCCCSRFNS